MTKAIDKFWLFGIQAGCNDTHMGTQLNRGGSFVTPAEGAYMLGVPNMIMVGQYGRPVPFSPEARNYCETFTPMKKVMWHSTGSAGFRSGNEEAYICEIAAKYDNITGSFMDDFFGKFRNITEPERTEKASKLLCEIRNGLDQAVRHLDLYVVWYTHEFEAVDQKLFQYIDGITIWTWDSNELNDLENRFNTIEEKFPNKKKLLGIYMYDFKNKISIPIELMAHQCNLGLKLMQQGRLDGLIFEANSVMGVELPSELWLRQWIRSVGETEVS